MESRPIIIFDGICNFCNGSVNFIINRDIYSVFTFTPMQSDTAKSLMCEYEISELGNDTFILIKNDVIYVRTNAALEITKDLPGHWYLFRVFEILPVSIRDLFYNLLVKNRYILFDKKDVCMVPSESVKNRFI